MYEVKTFCLIDRTEMRKLENDDSRGLYHCGVCGFEYWWLCTEEQAIGEAQKYLRNLSDEKIKEIAEAVENNILSFPTDEELKRRTREFYENLKSETEKKLGRLEKGLTILKSGKEGILESMQYRIFTLME